MDQLFEKRHSTALVLMNDIRLDIGTYSLGRLGLFFWLTRNGE